MKPRDFRKQLEQQQISSPHYRCHILAKQIYAQVVGEENLETSQINSAAQFESEEALIEAINCLIDQLPQTLVEFIDSVKKAASAKWYQNDFGEAGDYLLEHLESMFDDPLVVVLFFKELDIIKPTSLYSIGELFIRHAPLELVEVDVLLNKCSNLYYRAFIERFPEDLLCEFLTSKRSEARTLAVNKLRAS